MENEDGKDRSLKAFMRDYASGDAANRVVLDLDLAEKREYSPFIVVRHGGYVAVINPMWLSGYMDIDVHPFVNGQDGAAGVMGMNWGERLDGFRGDETPLRVNRWPAARMVALFVGDVTEVTPQRVLPKG